MALRIEIIDDKSNFLGKYFLGLTEFKYVIFNYVLVILLSFSYYFR